jgi:hypothetical protein
MRHFQRLHHEYDGFVVGGGDPQGLPALNESPVERVDFRAPSALDVLQHGGPVGTFLAMGVDRTAGVVLGQADAGGRNDGEDLVKQPVEEGYGRRRRCDLEGPQLRRGADRIYRTVMDELAPDVPLHIVRHLNRKTLRIEDTGDVMRAGGETAIDFTDDGWSGISVPRMSGAKIGAAAMGRSGKCRVYSTRIRRIAQ